MTAIGPAACSEQQQSGGAVLDVSVSAHSFHAGTPLTDVIETLTELTDDRIASQSAGAPMLAKDVLLEESTLIDALRAVVNATDRPLNFGVERMANSETVFVHDEPPEQFPEWENNAPPVERWIYETRDRALSDDLLCTRVYDASNLLNFFAHWPDADQNPLVGNFVVNEFSTAVGPAQQLERMLFAMAWACCRWVTTDGEGGHAQCVGQMLVVRQTYAGQREVVKLLNAMNAIMRATPPEAGPIQPPSKEKHRRNKKKRRKRS